AGEPGEAEARTCGARDQCAVAVAAVAGDADVVAGGVPAERDLRLGLAAGDETAGRGGRLRVGRRRRRATDGRVHVGLELGRRESTVVDAKIVDLAGEPLGPDGVAAD